MPGATSAAHTTKSGGDFSVSVTDNHGCSAKSETVTISKYSSPLKPTVSQVGNDLKSSAQNGNQWYKDGIAINGAVLQTFTPGESGNYSVQVTQNGCKSSMSETFSFLVTSVVSIDNTHFIKISPNPVQSAMNLEFHLNGIYLLNIDLLDVNGRIMNRWKNQKTGTVLYVTGCPSAVYLAKIFSSNGKVNATLKLIKQ